jgi:hypothetical protein
MFLSASIPSFVHQLFYMIIIDAYAVDSENNFEKLSLIIQSKVSAFNLNNRVLRTVREYIC